MTAKERHEFAVAMGRQGGKANARAHGHDHFVKLGKKGGAANKAAWEIARANGWKSAKEGK